MTGCLAWAALAQVQAMMVDVTLEVYECDPGVSYDIGAARVTFERDGYIAYAIEDWTRESFRTLASRGRITQLSTPRVRVFAGRQAEIRMMTPNGDESTSLVVRVTPKLLANHQWEFLTEVSREHGLGKARRVDWSLRARPMMSLDSTTMLVREVGPNRRRIVTFLRGSGERTSPDSKIPPTS